MSQIRASAGISRSSHRVISASDDCTVRLFDVLSGGVTPRELTYLLTYILSEVR